MTGDGQYLLVTNAASDDLSVFSVTADGSIELRERVHTAPLRGASASATKLVVVLNTGEPGAGVVPIGRRGHRTGGRLSQALDPSHADPAQVAFSPDGTMVLITERATDSIVTYEVTADGTFQGSSEIASEGPTLRLRVHLGRHARRDRGLAPRKRAAAASSCAIEGRSLVTRTSSVGNGRSEICWAVITPDDRFALTTNFADVCRLALRDRLRRFFVAGGCTAGISVDGMHRPARRGHHLATGGSSAIDADGGRIYGWSVDAEGLARAGRVLGRVAGDVGGARGEMTLE